MGLTGLAGNGGAAGGTSGLAAVTADAPLSGSGTSGSHLQLLASSLNGRGADASKPGASTANTGWLYLSTDIAGGTLYRSNGTTWDAISAGVTAAPQAHAASHANGGSDAISGIVAAQVASVNPSVLTGSGTVPLAGIPAHGSTHQPGGTDDLWLDYGHLGSANIENFPILMAADANTGVWVVASGTGTAIYAYFTPRITRTITKLFLVSITAAANLANFWVGIYGVTASTGALTSAVMTPVDALASSFANISPGNGFTSTGIYTLTITSTALTAGTRYCLALLPVGSTSPTGTKFAGLTTSIGSITSSALLGNPKFLSTTGLAALPAAGSLPVTPASQPSTTPYFNLT